MLSKRAVLTACLTIVAIVCQAQPQVSVHSSAVRFKQRLDETTPITDQATGKRITMQAYSQLIQADPYAYHLIPDYNEYGQPGSYVMRVTTPEEHETHQFHTRDPAKQPQVGQPIAPFSMTGLDEKTYRSADLLGNVVILGFLVSLDKPFWSDKQTEELANALRSYQSETGPIVLGILNSEQPKVVEHLNAKALPFMPVPNAYGFHNKYHILTIPTFIVIDKTGKVAANLQGPESYEKLKQILATLSR